jgi:Holliday junction resolvasome RuvABC endonuclease subunit
MNGKEIVIAGVDPGLAKAGITIVKLLNGYEKPSDAKVLLSEVFKSKKSNKKERRQDEDLLRRLREYIRWFSDILDTARPRIVISESLSYPRNARSSAMLAMGWGAVQTYCGLNKISTFIFSPQEIKMGCGLGRDASKQKVEDFIRELWSYGDWPSHGQREHAFDGAGAIAAFLHHENWSTVLLGV